MANLPGLENLKDIHLPPAIGWWPWALGWYVVIGLSAVLVGWGLYKFYQRYNNKRYQRHALNLLKQYHANYQQEPDAQAVSIKLCELLKQMALIYFPRSEVASLQGDEWIGFLNKTSKKLDFNSVRYALIELPYQKTNKQVDLESLFQHVNAWIKQRGSRCLK